MRVFWLIKKSKKEIKIHQSALVEKREKEITYRTQKKYNTEEKILIALEAGKKRLLGYTVREDNTSEIKPPRHQNVHFKL